MQFTPEQKKELEAKLNGAHVATRTQSGRTYSYIEGWWAIAEANRIFGFDGWHRETMELLEVRKPEYVKGARASTWRVGYMAKVKITVGDPHSGIVREGTGFGSGAASDLGESIESAIKEAETDAMKRAFMTFGNPFGLALYDKKQENVENGSPVPAPSRSSMALKKSGPDGKDAWERLCDDLDADFIDCNSMVALDKLKQSYWDRAKHERWPGSWIASLRGKFNEHEAKIKANDDTFPGDLPDGVKNMSVG